MCICCLYTFYVLLVVTVNFKFTFVFITIEVMNKVQQEIISVHISLFFYVVW